MCDGLGDRDSQLIPRLSQAIMVFDAKHLANSL
jgi:hypothetical protein